VGLLSESLLVWSCREFRRGSTITTAHNIMVFVFESTSNGEGNSGPASRGSGDIHWVPSATPRVELMRLRRRCGDGCCREVETSVKWIERAPLLALALPAAAAGSFLVAVSLRTAFTRRVPQYGPWWGRLRSLPATAFAWFFAVLGLCMITASALIFVPVGPTALQLVMTIAVVAVGTPMAIIWIVALRRDRSATRKSPDA